MIEHHFVESRIKEHLMLAISASSWPAGLLSPRSYCNAVMEQRSHKGVTERSKHSSSKIKRQLNVRARYYSKVGEPLGCRFDVKFKNSIYTYVCLPHNLLISLSISFPMYTL